MNQLNRIKIVKIALWGVVFLWLVLIFALSAQPAERSDLLSKRITGIIAGAISWIASLDIDAKTINGLISVWNNVVRKFAHGWVYFILGILVIKAITYTRLTGFKAYVLTLVFCSIYAASDEFHQLFVPGRSGQISDVLIDLLGAVFGMVVYWFFKNRG
ncbi:MAG: VanZ family protein [Pelosinus sp.]|nr:VanZ family protein [Pelosinus sp.]